MRGLGLWLLLSCAVPAAHCDSLARACQRLFQRVGEYDVVYSALAAPLERLDSAFDDYVRGLTAGMTARQLARFEVAIAEARLRSMPRSLIRGALTSHWFAAPEMSLSTWLKSHPMSRIVIAHELSHLARVARSDGAISNFVRELRIYQPKALINEERLAHGDTYDFVRTAFGPDDLAAFRQRLVTTVPPSTIAPLRAAGIIDARGNFSKGNDIADRLRSDPELRRAAESYFLAEKNRYFLKDVEDALTLDRDTYLTQRVHSGYHAAQAEFDRTRRRALGVAGATAAVGGAGYFYFMLTNNDEE